jgi:hypothetical protein
MFPSILCANCQGETLLEISKFYKNLYVSSLNYQKEILIYEKVKNINLFLLFRLMWKKDQQRRNLIKTTIKLKNMNKNNYVF